MPSPPGAIRFGEAEWDRATRRLRVRGDAVALTHRAGLCLDVLIDAAGAPVSRETLIDQAWDGSVVENSNLSHCIVALRRALDPAPDGASYIETVPRVGYRLAVPIVAPTEGPAAADADPTSIGGGHNGVDQAHRGTAQHGRWRVAAATAIVLVIAAALGSWSLWSRRTAARPDVNALIDESFRLMRRGNAQDGQRAGELLDHAIALQPDLPRLKAALAEASARYGKYSFSLATDMARAAVDADPACVECRAVLGYVLMTRDWNWRESGPLLEGAVADDRSAVQPRLWWSLWLSVHGRLDDAAQQADDAARLDPLSAAAHGQRAAVQYLAGRYDEAVAAAARAIQLNPLHQPAHYWTTRSWMMLNRASDVIGARINDQGAWSNLSVEARHAMYQRYSRVLAEGGRAALVDDWLADVAEGHAREGLLYDRAVWQAWDGRVDAALSDLEEAVAHRPYRLMFLGVDPMFAPLRSSARFGAVLDAIGLPAAPGAEPTRR